MINRVNYEESGVYKLEKTKTVITHIKHRSTERCCSLQPSISDPDAVILSNHDDETAILSYRVKQADGRFIIQTLHIKPLLSLPSNWDYEQLDNIKYRPPK